MSQAKLILSQSPPPWVPLRFFVTAPLFALFAAVLALWSGPEIFVSRWSAPLLALTHLLVLGFMAMVMTGALIQVVSVLLGGEIPGIRINSALVHGGLSLGTISLAMGFIHGNPWFMRSAVLLLGLAFCMLAWILLQALRSSSSRSDSAIGIGLALIALLITVVLGLWLASGYAWEDITLARPFTDTHLVWGLLGWVGILVVTIAYEVVPMFQLTPPYPTRLTPWLAPVQMLALVTWSSWFLLSDATLSQAGGYLAAFTLLLFALVTLWLQQRRKKKQPDSVVWFWRAGLVNLIAAACLWLYAQAASDILQQPEWQLLLGTTVILGFAISLINSMLYKIIPFLIWLHLSIRVTNLKLSRRLIPNIKKMLPDASVRPQFWLHLLSLGLFLAAAFHPAWFLLPAALAFAASNILLLKNITLALRLYTRTEAEISRAGDES
jgi:hypothetical protein